MNLKKIAKAAGVSVSTASKAINNSFDVSDKTRERVLTIANELGYFSSKKKQSIENKKAKNYKFAIICPEIISTFYSHLVLDFVQAIEESDSTCIIYNSGFDTKIATSILEECLKDLSIQGIICLSHIEETEQNPNIPVICFSSHEEFSTINCDSGLLDAAQFLFGKYTNVSFIGENNTASKQGEFLQYAQQLTDINPSVTVSSLRFEAAGRDAAKKIIKSGGICRAYLCAYDEIALGFIDEMTKQGYKIPEDIAVMGINNIPSSSYCFGGLSTINLEYTKVCCQIIDDMLIDLKNKDIQKRSYQVETSLIIRHTA